MIYENQTSFNIRIKFVTFIWCFNFTCCCIINTATPASTSKTSQLDQTQNTLTTSNNELAKAIKEEKVSQKELTRYSLYVKTQVNQTGEVTPKMETCSC